ncbi:MAG: hypothetical protein ACP5NQ_03680, partial [Vulcanisaeta sp.]
CSRLPKLCPRLVPSPLWGVSLANIAKMSPYLAEALCDDCGDVIRRVRDWWFSLDRSGPCEVCGAPGAEIDEEWSYVINEGGGTATITYLRRLCRECHLAKHQGYAKTHGLSERAINHLAHVNGIDANTAKSVVNKAFRVWHNLNFIYWTIKIDDIGLPDDLRGRVEELMNNMAFMRCHRSGKYFKCLSVSTVAEDASSETLQLLEKVKDYSQLIDAIKEKLESSGITVLDDALSQLINQETVKRILASGRLDDDMFYAPIIGGAWVILLRREDIYGRVFVEILKGLDARNLRYETMTLFNPRGGSAIPLIFHTPSFLALGTIVNVAKVINNVLSKYGIRTKVYFKPRLFMEKRISNAIYVMDVSEVH